MTEEERAELATAIITSDPHPAFVPRPNDGAIFLGRHPFGIAPVGKVAWGGLFEFSPLQLATVGASFTDAQFVALCEAVRMWQQTSASSFVLQLPPDLIVETFMTDYPEHGAVFAAAALHHHAPLVRFLGADRGTGIQS